MWTSPSWDTGGGHRLLEVAAEVGLRWRHPGARDEREDVDWSSRVDVEVRDLGQFKHYLYDGVVIGKVDAVETRAGVVSDSVNVHDRVRIRQRN